MAKRLAKALEPHESLFIEEPVLPENNEALPEIAAMAEAHDISVGPHCPLGPIALASCIHSIRVRPTRSFRNSAATYTITNLATC
ncbi:hypothetical protein JCM18750_41830 [Halostagnicola bangensis]